MDNELFELCKSVYEKTGWDEIKFYYSEYGILYITQLPAIENSEIDIIPLYTSDYLLEKLDHLEKEFGIDRCFHMGGSRDWRARLQQDFMMSNDLLAYPDTTLKALLKLTIKLADEGIITKGDK